VVLFLADGRIVDEMARPTAEAVLERMKRFDVIRGPFDRPFGTEGSPRPGRPGGSDRSPDED
jgi:putative ABC transport system ATP-binding protein